MVECVVLGAVLISTQEDLGMWKGISYHQTSTLLLLDAVYSVLDG